MAGPALNVRPTPSNPRPTYNSPTPGATNPSERTTTTTQPAQSIPGVNVRPTDKPGEAVARARGGGGGNGSSGNRAIPTTQYSQPIGPEKPAPTVSQTLSGSPIPQQQVMSRNLIASSISQEQARLMSIPKTQNLNNPKVVLNNDNKLSSRPDNRNINPNVSVRVDSQQNKEKTQGLQGFKQGLTDIVSIPYKTIKGIVKTSTPYLLYEDIKNKKQININPISPRYILSPIVKRNDPDVKTLLIAGGSAAALSTLPAWAGTAVAFGTAGVQTIGFIRNPTAKGAGELTGTAILFGTPFLAEKLSTPKTNTIFLSKQIETIPSETGSIATMRSVALTEQKSLLNSRRFLSASDTAVKVSPEGEMQQFASVTRGVTREISGNKFISKPQKFGAVETGRITKTETNPIIAKSDILTVRRTGVEGADIQSVGQTIGLKKNTQFVSVGRSVKVNEDKTLLVSQTASIKNNILSKVKSTSAGIIDNTKTPEASSVLIKSNSVLKTKSNNIPSVLELVARNAIKTNIKPTPKADIKSFLPIISAFTAPTIVGGTGQDQSAFKGGMSGETQVSEPLSFSRGLTGNVIGIDYKTTNKVSPIINTKTSTIQSTPSAQIQKSVPIQKQPQTQVPRSGQGSGQGNKQIEEIIQVPKEVQQFRTPQKTTPSLKTPTINQLPIPRVPQIPIRITRQDDSKLRSALIKISAGYDIFTKKRKRDIKVASDYDLRQSALKLRSKLKSGLEASGYIVERSTGKRVSFGEIANVLGSDFRKGKRDLTLIVQSKGGKEGGAGRLSTGFERREIKAARRRKAPKKLKLI